MTTIDTGHLDTDEAGETPESKAPTSHAELVAWVGQVAALTLPETIRWVDGSAAENEEIVSSLVASGTFTRLEGKPDSFWCASDPTDVARVEDRTFICSREQVDAGPTNNWMDPERDAGD